MRRTTLVASAFAILACSKSQRPAARPTSGATSAPAGATTASTTNGAPEPITGRTWDVRMVAAGDSYRFAPATLTIKRGDGVRWTLVAGPGHNVTFWSDSIPPGASSVLGRNMPQTTAPLASPLLVNPSQTYLVSFGGVPAGIDHYYCAPHLVFGMVGTIVVQ
jgi:plastocyanin